MNDKIKILAVDDDPLMLSLIIKLLERDGYDILSANNGREALKITREELPDLLLLDLSLPDIDGIEVCKEIKSNEKLQHIYITIVSATRKNPDDRAEAIELGADDFIQKPFENRELLARVHSAIRIVKSNKALQSALNALKSSEQFFKNSEQFLNNVLNSLTHPFYVIDAKNYTIVLANNSSNFGKLDAMSRCYKLTHNIDYPCNDIEHPCPLKIVKETKKPLTVEHIHYDKDGNKRCVEIHAYPIFRSDGEVEKLIEYSFDITEQKRIQSELIEYTTKLERELDKKRKNLLKAQSIQQNLNTKKLPNIKDINLLAYYSPCEELGGDFFNIEYIDDKLIIIIGDCEGHDIESAMDSVLIKSIYDRYIHLLVEYRTDEFLNAINNDIVSYFHGEKFLTMFACVVNTNTKEIHYSSANSEIPYIINDGKVRRLTKSEGYHIGFSVSNGHYQRMTTKLNEGDILFFYSDAVRELKLNDGNILGCDGIEEIIKNFGKGLSNDLEYFTDEIKKINKKLPLDDDTTLIFVENITPIEKHYIAFTEQELNNICVELESLLSRFDYTITEIDEISVGFGEMYSNALIHGNKHNTSKEVKVDIHIDCESVKITVEDAGDGFDINNVPDPTDFERLMYLLENDKEEEYSHGRGIFIAKFYMDTVEYNPKGNKVCITKKRKNKTTVFENIENEYVQPVEEKDINKSMVIWKKDMNEAEIINSKQDTITIDFKNIPVLNSLEVNKLLRILRNCNINNRKLKFKIENHHLKDLLLDLGFERLGVEML